LNGGYLTVGDGEEIPKNLTGLAYWSRQFHMMTEDMKGEIDMVFMQVGIDKYVPKTLRYIIVLGLFMSPLIVLIGLLCCCFDEEPDQPKTLVSGKTEKAKTAPAREKID
jgi:hypothetical protein